MSNKIPIECRRLWVALVTSCFQQHRSSYSEELIQLTDISKAEFSLTKSNTNCLIITGKKTIDLCETRCVSCLRGGGNKVFKLN